MRTIKSLSIVLLLFNSIQLFGQTKFVYDTIFSRKETVRIVSARLYNNDNNKIDTILSVVKNYWSYPQRKDTLIIKEWNGHRNHYGFIFIINIDGNFYIQEYKDYGKFRYTRKPQIDQLELTNELKIPQKEFFYLLESELLKSRYDKSEVCHYKAYQFEDSLYYGDKMIDVFGYPLKSFYKNYRDYGNIKDYFIDSDIRWIQRIHITSCYKKDIITHDTSIAEKIYSPNGDYIEKLVESTKNPDFTNEFGYWEVTLDSTENELTKMYKQGGFNRNFRKEIKGNGYTLEIDYDKNWISRSIKIFSNKKKDSPQIIISQDLLPYDRFSMRSLMIKRKNYLGIIKREKVFLKKDYKRNISKTTRLLDFLKIDKYYDLENEENALNMKTVRIFSKEKHYHFYDGMKYLDSKIKYRKYKSIETDFDKTGQINSQSICTYDIENDISETKEYNSKGELIKYRKSSSIEETGEKAKKRLDAFFNINP